MPTLAFNNFSSPILSAFPSHFLDALENISLRNCALTFSSKLKCRCLLFLFQSKLWGESSGQ